MIEYLAGTFTSLWDGLWLDETFTIFLSQKSISDITFLTLSDFNPPLYYYFIHYWMIIFGSSPFAIRIPSLITYLLFIPLFNKALKFMEIEKYTRYAFLVFIFTSPAMLYFATEGRMYIMQAALVLISLILINKRSAWFILTNVVLLFLNTSSLFFVLGLFLYFGVLFFKDKDLSIRLSIYNVISFIFYIPWLITFYLVKISDGSINTWVSTNPNLFTLFALPIQLYIGRLSDFFDSTGPIYLIITIVFIYSLIKYGKKDIETIKNTPNTFYSLLWLSALGSLIIFTIISFQSHIFYWRYYWFSFAPIFIILAVYLDRIIHNKITLSMILISVSLINIYAFGYWNSYLKINISDKAQLLRENQVVLIENAGWLFPYQYYLGKDNIKVIGVMGWNEVPAWKGKIIMKPEDFIFGDYKISDFEGEPFPLPGNKNAKIINYPLTKSSFTKTEN